MTYVCKSLLPNLKIPATIKVGGHHLPFLPLEANLNWVRHRSHILDDLAFLCSPVCACVFHFKIDWWRPFDRRQERGWLWTHYTTLVY